MFDGCCLLQTIKAAFPPLLGPPLTPVYGCVCVCVRHGRPVLLLLLLLLLLGCSAFQAAKAHKREESSSLFVSPRLASPRLCAPVLDVRLCLGPCALFKQTTLTAFVDCRRCDPGTVAVVVLLAVVVVVVFILVVDTTHT